MPEIIVDLPPSFKAPEVDAVLDKIFGRSRTKSIKDAICIKCEDTDLSFKDELSAIEYSISGLRQPCQDDLFGDE